MAKSVYYSFHYEQDVMRVQQVLNIGAIEHQPILNPQEWEQVKRGGEKAIQEWIDNEMTYKRAVVVLVGSLTSTRPWVQHEIRKAWNDKRPLVGVRIHGLIDPRTGRSDNAGADPFKQIRLTDGKTIGDYVTLHNPSGSTSREVYASISASLADWVDGAFRRS